MILKHEAVAKGSWRALVLIQGLTPWITHGRVPVTLCYQGDGKVHLQSGISKSLLYLNSRALIEDHKLLPVTANNAPILKGHYKRQFFTKLLTSEVFLQKELFWVVFEISHLPRDCCFQEKSGVGENLTHLLQYRGDLGGFSLFKKVNPVCRCAILNVLICYILSVYLNYSCLPVCYRVIARVLLEHRVKMLLIWGISLPSAAVRMVSARWHIVSRCCEKPLPERITADINFLQKARESVVAFMRG